MKTLPILFNTEMVRSILDGQKTCTRRVVKTQPDEKHTFPLGFVAGSMYAKDLGCFGFGTNENGGSIQFAKPPYQTGDILYVRETWCKYGDLDDNEQVIDGTEKYYYRADGENPTPYNQFLIQNDICDEYRDFPVWHPSIHMPKEAARIWLRVTDVRVERLQEITKNECIKEGIYPSNCRNCNSTFECDICPDEGYDEVDKFVEVWNNTIKKSDLDKYGWDANPWVWAIEFEKTTQPKCRFYDDNDKICGRFDGTTVCDFSLCDTHKCDYYIDENEYTDEEIEIMKEMMR